MNRRDATIRARNLIPSTATISPVADMPSAIHQRNTLIQ
jgi:hypothetical protein